MPEKRFIPPRARRSGQRDARLIVIAAEGQNTERRYFEDLAEEHSNSRIHVEVLERLDSASDPVRVLRLLDSFRRKYTLRPNYDELWLVIDVDQWRDRKLSDVASLCNQKRYFMAVSNPCFEIWLLLHHKSLDEYDVETLGEFRLNRKAGDRTRLESELVRLLGRYNSSNLDTTDFLPYVEIAVERARNCDLNPGHRWPNDLGSRVYLLSEKIIRM